ncbi:MAG: homoserine dehydrogenase [Deltaproteobacteria bacterium]|nr:homoserine dehydrogenase [Deltaproteobacteria bacterium]
MEDTIKIGLCGLGTVGSGVFELLQENADLIRNRIGRNIIVSRVATLDRYDNLGLDLSKTQVSDSVDDILRDPEINIVVELIGGKTIAKKIVLESLQKGKSAVTANKALLAEYTEEIFQAAYRSKGNPGFEASVAGGIPIVRSIKQGFSGDRIDKFMGIVNGTANYILSAMSSEGVDFDQALNDAQKKGYAEADPTFDIEGIDAAHKVIILMALSFNGLFDFSQLYVEGITGIESIDIAIAEESGYAIKLLGCAARTENGYEGKVCPALVDKKNMLAAVTGAFNAVSIWGNFVGETLSYGAGAGSHPTASAVVSDIIETARLMIAGMDNPVPPLNTGIDALTRQDILPMSETESEYYLRIASDNAETSVDDILKILGDAAINLKSMEQKSGSGDLSLQKYLILFTEKSNEEQMQSAIQKLNTLSVVAKPVKMIRVEH